MKLYRYFFLFIEEFNIIRDPFCIIILVYLFEKTTVLFQYVYLFEKNIPDLNGTLIDPIQQQTICEYETN